MAFAKLSKHLYTRNIMGLSKESLEEHCKIDPWYEKVIIGGEVAIEADKAGEIITLESPLEFNIEKGYSVHIEINPAVHEFGSVGYEQVIGSGKVKPIFVIRAHKKGDLYLEWLYKARLYV